MGFIAKVFGFKGRINVGSMAKPAKPVINLSVSGSLIITITWAAASGASSYYVTRNGVTIPASIGTTSLYYVDTVPAAGVYTYKVVAVNEAGSTASDPSTITAVEFEAPALFRFESGGLIIDISWSTTDVPILTFKDGVNDISAVLPFTANEIAGIDWAIIKVCRSGSSLIISVDKTDLVAVPLIVVPYGGNVHIGEFSNAKLYDIRMLQNLVSRKAMDYYIDDVTQNSGNAMMPTR